MRPAKRAEQLRKVPAEQIAAFLEAYAKLIEANAEKLVSIANLETALPIKPRLADVELPRTTGQLRQAAAAGAKRILVDADDRYEGEHSILL